MSISAIKSAAEWVGKLALEEVKHLGNVRDNVEDLKSELEWMQCFLLDADVKQNNDALIRKWMSEISDLSLEAEEIIETYILKVSKKRGIENGFLEDLLWLTCLWKDFIRLHKVGSQIDGVTSKISKLTSRLQMYGVRGPYDYQSSHKDRVRTLLAEQRRTYSHDEANYVVGIEPHVKHLITQLQAPQKILVVHGMGGIGKTTLARQIFGDRRSKECFAGVAWAYVSQQVHLETICRDILYQLIPDKRNITRNLSNSELPGELCNVLKEKNYLVVLDDVWTVGDWQFLAPAFPVRDASFQSKLLITTRNPQILSHLGDGVVSTWEAKTLDDKSHWKLLQNKGNFTDIPDPVMEEVAKKMLKRCDGNPLAIVALGGVLATKKSLNEWESVLDNLQSHLQGDELYSRVYDVLAMGYYDLHYNIKPCFLHMGHFPEDFRISVERVYNIWIAEGIVSPIQDRIGSKRSLEDIADNYMNQLVQKGMIRVVDIDAYDKINTCSLHDLMRDKCLEIIREENFVEIVDLQRQNASNIGDADKKKVRRLTMHVGRKTAGNSVLKASSENVSSLRSLMFISTCAEEDRKEVTSKWIKDVCERFELLRVLDFEGVVLKETLPSEVGNLIYLRYLSLKGTRVAELPSSICNLRSLLILDLRVTKVRIKLPNVFRKLISLRHLYFPTRVLSQEKHAVRCQGYEIEDGNVLLNLDNLSHLERVDNVDLDRVDDNCLRKLSSIGKLSATCKSQSRGWDGLVSVLESSSIKHLSLKVDAGLLFESSSMVLSKSESLRILHIDSEREPPCFLPIRAEMFPRNLVELGFWYCMIEEDPMPILEQLKNLKILQFRICYDGPKMKCSATGFPGVTYLALDGLWYLEDWSVDRGGFPKLQEIEIYNCPLKAFPDTLPPNLLFSCTLELQEKVNEFRQRVRVPEDQSGSSTGGLINVACSTLE